MKDRKILVPLDASPTSAQAVKSLISLKEDFTFPLTLLHVLDLSALACRGFTELTLAGAEENARARARQFITEQRDAFAAAGMATVTLVKEGDACEIICQLADSTEYDLLVVGRNPVIDGRTPTFGPLANEIVYRVKCPVLIV